ncbi:TPA: phosphoglycerol transferase I [Enterobacter kobei]|nr:phosphoglycerol transferase I [Enterobacter kobei]
MDYILLVLLLAVCFANASFLRTKSIVVVITLLIFSFWFISNMFTGNGVNDAVYYHMKSNIHGTSIDDILPKIYAGSSFILISFVIILSAFKLRKKLPQRYTLTLNSLFILILSIFLFQSNATKNIFNSFQNLSYGNGINVADQYKNTDFNLKDNYNYVFIYAESLERSLRNIAGTNYIPHLSEIADNYIDFTNIQQIPGMGWTMAGIVNTQCAIPLVLPQGNSGNNISHFLSGADCIATHLQKRGYTTEFIRGSDKEFAGGDKFFSQHGWLSQHDKQYLINHHVAEDKDISGWGVHDDILIEHAYNEYEKLSTTKKNFLLSFLTVNTHPPEGTYLSTCDGHINPSINNSMLRAASCSDYLLSTFIKKIINSEHFDNTIIVLVSDHLMMANAASKELEDIQDKRRNNFIIIKKGISPTKIDKPGTLLDVWPTILDTSSTENPDFGFGHSLLGNNESNILSAWEKSKSIGDYLGFSSQLWNYPSLNDKIFLKDGILTIGQQQYKWPVYGIADKNKNIKNIYFDAFALNAQKIISKDGIAFYINDCSVITDNKKGLCAYELTSKGTIQYQIDDKGIFNRRKNHIVSPLFFAELIGISSGPLNVQTGISDYINVQDMPTGVNLFGLNKINGEVEIVANFNTCSNTPVDINVVKKLVEKDNSPLIIASNDSVFCIPHETRPSVNKLLRSDAATHLASRQQIIGIFNTNDTKYIIGKPEIPLDVFINKKTFKLYKLCDIFTDCK